MVWVVWVQCRQCPLRRVISRQHFVSITSCICHVSYGLDHTIVEKQNRETKYHSGYYRCNSRIGGSDSSLRIYQYAGCILSRDCAWVGILLHGLASQAAP